MALAAAIRAGVRSGSRRLLRTYAWTRAWGFANPSFFTSKFREAFGVTPRQLIVKPADNRAPRDQNRAPAEHF